MELPREFQERMHIQLGPEGLDAYRESLSRKTSHALRVNRLKLDTEEFKRVSPFPLRPVPWCENGFYVETEENRPSRHPYYYAGLYYLQEPSAALPAALLPVEPGDRVLDLCAAPGGKSTELAAKLKNSGFLLANDISATRCKALIKNLELFGVKNAAVTAETPERLAKRFPDYFDKILIDAPCSGEGMFRKSSAMMGDWTPEKTKEYAALQREILEQALKMLRPGGMILYSTCTFAPEEDEGSVQYILNTSLAREKGLTLRDIPACPGFLQGVPAWIPDGTEDLKKTVHLFPHLVEGEGHYAALFQSIVPVREGEERIEMKKGQKSFSAYSPFQDFCEQYLPGKLSGEIRMKDGYLSLIPEDMPQLSGLRVMRQGLFLGEAKKNRFEPSQALAMALQKEDFSNILSLSITDERVMRYLKGETLFASPEEEKTIKEGWILILLEGYPLGFGKNSKGSIKNKLLPGWRME